MTPEQYAARQQLITLAVANFTFQFGKLFVGAALSPLEWLRLLRFLFPEVTARREQSALLAREFYDSQRAQVLPELPRNDSLLESSDFEVFVRSMEPARKRMSSADSRDDALSMLTLQVVREVENAGRRQIINAVKSDEVLVEYLEAEQDDDDEVEERAEVVSIRLVDNTPPEPAQAPLNLRETKRQIAAERRPRAKVVRGWARVATGRETCAWCLMLISRGPVYMNAGTAGLDLDDQSAVQMFAAGEDVTDYMEEWHTGCDCKVIPVFKTDVWEDSPYGAASERALELWNEASEEAEREIEERGSRVHTVGKDKGQEMTFNEEVILALRRRLARGDINPSEFAGLAA